MVQVKEEKMLNYADILNNNNKYYHIKVIENGGGYQVYAEYGRLGAVKPAVWTKDFMDEYTAIKEYNSKLNSKKKKGYIEVDIAGVDIVDTKPVKDGSDSDKSGSNQKDGVSSKGSITDPAVLKLIQSFLGNAQLYIKKNVKTPLGKLSKKQTSNGRRLLKDIQSEIQGGGSQNEIIRLSNEFYRYIPVVFGRNPDKKELLIDDQVKLQRYIDLLDVIDSIVNTADVTNIEQSYKNLGLEIKVLSKRTKAYKEIEKGMEENRGQNHHFNIRVDNVYEVIKDEWSKDFNPYGVETKLLYHGSRTENYMKILQSGLVANPQGVHITGKMFGQGIYFADCSTKSAQYCAGFGNSKRGTYYMMVCEVATGKEYELYSSNSSLRTAPRGYNSVKGVKGKSLVHNEYIVYKDNQVKIKYIVEFTM